MKEIDSYGLEICKYQAELFVKSSELLLYSSKIFLRRFMLSDLAVRMDTNGFMYESISKEAAIEEINRQFGESNYGKEIFSKEELYWIGYIYRYWVYTGNRNSKQLYRLVKPEELRRLYFPYHSLDPMQAIERIKEAKGIKDIGDLSKGVEVLRRIRKK